MKKLLLKLLDTNNNNSLEIQEWFSPLLCIICFELLMGILSNYIYDIIK